MWASGGRKDGDHVEEDLEAWGAPPEIAERYQGAGEEPDFEIFECNWPALEAFLTVQTQLRREGFRYEGVQAGLALAGISCDAELFAQLQSMEIAVVNHMSEREAARVRKSNSLGIAQS